MHRLGAVFLLACELSFTGCADEPAFETDAADPDLVAQELSPQETPLGPPIIPKQDEIRDIVVEAPIGTKVVKMMVADMRGPGCFPGRTLVRSDKRYVDQLDVRFNEDDFQAVTDPSKNRTKVTVECRLELRVRGAKGFQSVIQQLDHSGNSNIPFGATGWVQSNVKWRDDDFFALEGATEKRTLRGPYTGTWFMPHHVSVTSAAAARSKCFASDQDEDVVYIETVLGMESASQFAYIKITYTGSASFTEEDSALPALPNRSEAPMQFKVTAEPCTP